MSFSVILSLFLFRWSFGERQDILSDIWVRLITLGIIVLHVKLT